MNDCGATWQLRLCDPASIVCDELLEHDFVCQCCFLCDPKLRHSCHRKKQLQCSYETQLIKPRSRSEDNRCWRKRSDSTCSSGSDLSLSISHPDSYCNTGLSSAISVSWFLDHPCSRKVSTGSIANSGVVQELDSVSLPPPMRAIHVDRLGLQHVDSDSGSGSFECAGQFSTDSYKVIGHHSPICVEFKPVMSYVTTGCSITKDTGVISVPSDYGSRSLYTTRSSRESCSSPQLRRPATSHVLDISAHDSGLSSHSSSSTCFCGHIHKSAAGAPCESSCCSVPPIPPPVPPHAPNSRAAATAASLSNSPSVPTREYTDSLHTNTESFHQNRMNGLTIRLTNRSNESKAAKKPSVLGNSLAEPIRWIDEPDFPEQTSSPIWKRKSPEFSDFSFHTCSTTLVTDDKPSVLGSDSLNIPQATVSATQSLFPVTSSSDPSKCEQCEIAKRFFFTEKQNFTDFDRRTFITSSPSNSCALCRRILLNVGVNLFNRDPLRSLRFLERNAFMQIDCPRSIASFIQTAPNLCRSQIGAFLGLPGTPRVCPSNVMHYLLQSLNFHGLEVDEALRLTVHHFGMPVESQEIDRFLECLANVYYTVRWPSTSPVSRYQVLLLFYAVLLLQTSLHNENAAKSSLGKQTASGFVKNCQSFLFNTLEPDLSTPLPQKELSTDDTLEERKSLFSHAALSAIYRRIKLTPIVPGADHTRLTDQIARSLLFPGSHSNCDHVSRLEGVDLQAEICKPHHRVVFSCAVVQLSSRPITGVQVGFLRQVILFNDLILLIKLVSPDKSRLRGKRGLHLRRRLSYLLRGAMPDSTEQFLSLNFRPWNVPPHRTISPTDVHITPHEHVSLPQRKTKELRHRVPLNFPTVFKSIAVCGIPLLDCIIRPFRTQECCFGLEIWKLGNSAQPEQLQTNVSNGAPGDCGCWQLVTVLAALSHTDYGHLLSLLLDCLRETHLVHQELTSRATACTSAQS